MNSIGIIRYSIFFEKRIRIVVAVKVYLQNSLHLAHIWLRVRVAQLVRSVCLFLFLSYTFFPGSGLVQPKVYGEQRRPRRHRPLYLAACPGLMTV